MDIIVFGPLTIPRHTLAATAGPSRCTECSRELKGGYRYGWLADGPVCEPCADQLEAGHR